MKYFWFSQTGRMNQAGSGFRHSRISFLLLLAGALTAPLGASIVNDTNATDVSLHTGEDLLFRVSIQDYQNEALLFGAPMLPTSFSFTLVTAPTDSAVQFQAGLESDNGSNADILPQSLTLEPGTFDSGNYSGPVSTLSGSFSLSSSQSNSLFAGGTAFLVITDLGGNVTIGLPPYTLTDDLYGSVYGGGLNVGAWTISTFYDPPTAVPEPGSGFLVFSGGIGLFIAAALQRRARRWFPSRSLRQ